MSPCSNCHYCNWLQGHTRNIQEQRLSIERKSRNLYLSLLQRILPFLTVTGRKWFWTDGSWYLKFVEAAISHIRELKHQTFLIHERHGCRAELGIGDAVYASNANHSANQRETITNADRVIHLKMAFKDLREVLFLSYEENMISEEDFLLLYDEYSSKNPELKPLVSTWELAFSSPWLQPKNVLTCSVAVMLQKYFRLASLVPRTSGA